MRPIDGGVLLALFAIAILYVVSHRSLVDALIEELRNFRGGPPTAMHPSPADDGRLLRKRERKAEDS